jgi:hypothetical protein
VDLCYDASVASGNQPCSGGVPGVLAVSNVAFPARAHSSLSAAVLDHVPSARQLALVQVEEQLFRAMAMLLPIELATLGMQWVAIRFDAPSSPLAHALQSRAVGIGAVAVAIGVVPPVLTGMLRSRSRDIVSINAAAIAVGAVGVRYLLFAGR